MAKGNNKVPAITLAGSTVATQQVAAPVLVVNLTAGAKLRGARAAWYAALCNHNGKPATAYLRAMALAPPTLPTKGKHAGVAEKPQGWLAWFVRNGYATLQAQA